MGNISKDLWSLFREYLIRKEKESRTPSTNYSYGGYNSNNTDYTHYDGIIYFYEWSDVNRCPLLFYNILSFSEFLTKSKITILPFQKDMIKNLDRAFITCKKGKTDLVIRSTKPALVEALLRDNAPTINLNELPTRPMPGPPQNQLCLPYHVAVTYPPGPQRQPPMYNYHGNPEEWYG